MIKVIIGTDGNRVYDELKTDKTTLGENSLVIRRLEEIKQVLLDMEYDDDLKEVQDEERVS